MSTRIPSRSNQLLYFLAKLCGIFARKLIAMISSNNGKCTSKPQTVKEITSWTYQTTTSIQSNHHTLKRDHGFKLLGTPILCAPELYEPLPIMHQLGSTTLGSSQMKISIVYATNTLSKLEGIYSMNAEDSIGTGTLGEIC